MAPERNQAAHRKRVAALCPARPGKSYTPAAEKAAATDTIGRSYSAGKTFDEFLAEAEAGAGSRYAPFVPELLKRPDCRRDIEYLLADGRERMYRETYRLLRRMAR